MILALHVLTPLLSVAAVNEIEINFTSPTAPFTFEYGVDHGPLCDAPCLQWSAGKCVNKSSAASVAGQLRGMGARYIRTHDMGVLDWPVVFPHPLSLAGGATTPYAPPPHTVRPSIPVSIFCGSSSPAQGPTTHRASTSP